MKLIFIAVSTYEKWKFLYLRYNKDCNYIKTHVVMFVGINFYRERFHDEDLLGGSKDDDLSVVLFSHAYSVWGSCRSEYIVYTRNIID